MKIRLKVLREFKKEWVCVCVSTEGNTAVVMCMNDDSPAYLKTMTVREYNALPHFWFTRGEKIAAKTGVKVKPGTRTREQFRRELEGE